CEQFGLLLLQRQNLLLDRILGDEAIDHDAACLSDPMRAVDRLGLGRRVPPRVEQKHIVGLGEGETEAAGLEADEEHGSAAGAEGLDDLRPVPRRPVEVLIGDALRVEFGGDGAQIAGELAEDERTMALGPDFGQVLQQHGQFARTDTESAYSSTMPGSRASIRSRVSERKIANRFFSKSPRRPSTCLRSRWRTVS